MIKSSWWCALGLVVVACGGDSPPPDAGETSPDAAMREDASIGDAAWPQDGAMVPEDANAPQDATTADVDATVPDPAVLAYWGAPVWRDEFDHRDEAGNPAIDPAKWNVRTRATLGLLNDASIVEARQITVDADGICHIRADWMDAPVTTASGPSSPDPTDRWHRTGYMEHRRTDSSDVIFAQQYGRWEIRARVPTGPNTLGALAAFWLRNEDTGELDIMESWGYGETPFPTQRIGTSTMTSHTNTSGTGNMKRAWTIENVLGITEPVHTEWHTWTLEWTPEYFRGYRDGAMFAEETPASYPNLWNPAYFGSPNHVRINLHIGPSEQYWGLPDPDRRELTQPLDYQIDYVRIWAMPE